MKKEIRKICKEVGVEIEIEDLRRIKTGREEGVVYRIGSSKTEIGGS